VIAYRAMVDVPRELVQHLGRLLAAERRARGTRTGTRTLTCFYQALMVLVWFRKAEDLTLLGAGFGISRATAYRYRDEGVAVLAAQARDLHTALRRVAADGWSHVILDGKLFDCDRLTETALSVKGEVIDAWYSGKHRDFGANIQAIMRPDGLPIWTSRAMPVPARVQHLTGHRQCLLLICPPSVISPCFVSIGGGSTTCDGKCLPAS
jgi:Helix-turn-helix of DDE superfamily endonuclease